MNRVLLLLFLSYFIIGCNNKKQFEKPPNAVDVAVKWADMTLFISKNTFANTPTYSSRALGYIGLTMYETVVHGYSNHQSLAGQLNQLEKLPLPLPDKKYDWVICLNAGQSYILKKIYNQTQDENKLVIDSLEKTIYDEYASFINDDDIAERSASYGKEVAEAIYQWSKTDGGDRGYLHNFDDKFVVKDKPGVWKPALFSQVVGHLPLHPHWGNNRTFLRADSEMPMPDFIAYSKDTTSEYFKIVAEVLQKNLTLTQPEKEIAMWWNDDPSDTYTPPGHSYNLGTIAIKKARPDLIKCAETYAKIGISVADAFINCWKCKYQYLSERPSTYINEVMDNAWESFWPNPPFPAFPSGHATQAAASAIVMTGLYGNNFSFTDNSHAGRPRDENKNVDYKARSFISFWQAAEETAQSRFYGGIHTKYDNNTGLAQGKIIGNNVNQLRWAKN
jgi:hypothetical protein